jgi:hypothetical protein
LSITVDELVVNGRIAANGLDAESEPFLTYAHSGGGAGGSIALVIGKLGGNGRIEARGADTCLPIPLMLNQPGVSGCYTGPEFPGGGGAGPNRHSLSVTEELGRQDLGSWWQGSNRRNNSRIRRRSSVWH